jgi:serine protease DegQ
VGTRAATSPGAQSGARSVLAEYTPSRTSAPLPVGARDRYLVADAIARVEPAVVAIDTVGRAPQEGRGAPEERFMWRFFGRPDRPSDAPSPRGVASGVLISADGTVVTNNHVVMDTRRIIVKLADQRRFEGVVLGADREADLAVIKIRGKNLPHAVLGDSSKLRKGEWVVALGNPLGLGSTATVGVVSASRRGPLPVEGRLLQSVIQTDAAINQGNSGGALVNLDGELVGINTAILSTSFSGGSIGIGFAIPVNDAWPIVRQLIRTGRVVRPWIGIQYASAAGDDEWQSLRPRRGVIVSKILEDSPAAGSGLAPGDVICRLGATPVAETADVHAFISHHSPGDVIEVSVLRRGAAKSFRLRLAQRPDEAPVPVRE